MCPGENGNHEKREAILQAVLELVVEHGLQHTPMLLISQRSSARGGIIYHYFESKEDLFALLYCQVKGDMGNALVALDDPQHPLAKRFETLWLSIFRYCQAHRQEMAFLEQYESIPKMEQQEEGELRDGPPTFNRLLDASATASLARCKAAADGGSSAEAGERSGEGAQGGLSEHERLEKASQRHRDAGGEARQEAGMSATQMGSWGELLTG